jgi:hypothetical protein
MREMAHHLLQKLLPARAWYLNLLKNVSLIES